MICLERENRIIKKCSIKTTQKCGSQNKNEEQGQWSKLQFKTDCQSWSKTKTQQYVVCKKSTSDNIKTHKD